MVSMGLFVGYLVGSCDTSTDRDNFFFILLMILLLLILIKVSFMGRCLPASSITFSRLLRPRSVIKMSRLLVSMSLVIVPVRGSFCNVSIDITLR